MKFLLSAVRFERLFNIWIFHNLSSDGMNFVGRVQPGYVLARTQGTLPETSFVTTIWEIVIYYAWTSCFSKSKTQRNMVNDFHCVDDLRSSGVVAIQDSLIDADCCIGVQFCLNGKEFIIHNVYTPYERSQNED